MADSNKIRNRQVLTSRLIILTGIALVFAVMLFALPFLGDSKLMVSWLVFICGIIGGFVSIQQRVKDIPDDELELLSSSWFQILLIPIFGSVFALVLYCVFLAQLLNSDIFPQFHIPAPPATGPNDSFIIDVLRKTYPSTGSDLAKLIFWSFVAGFAERFVPQIISNLTPKSD